MSDSIRRFADAAHSAAVRIAPLIRRTPFTRSPYFSRLTGAEVYLKQENLQHTGSFKLRGAANCLMSLTPEQRARGCTAASSGNHGAAVAYAMRELGIGGPIFVPEQTSPVKVEAIRAFGGDVRFFGTDGLDTEQHARACAEREGLYYVSPYNDEAVIAGQGTCGIEMLDDAPDLDAVFIAVGGGGLLSGVGSVLKTADPELRIVACQPRASAVMARSVAAGRILELPSEPTLSDGTAGGVEAGAITFELCRELADEFVLVDEEAIAAAMRRFSEAEGRVIEGAAGVAVAALLRSADTIRDKTVAVIVCGGNVSRETLESVLAAGTED
jgi:threonine dehydratase